MNPTKWFMIYWNVAAVLGTLVLLAMFGNVIGTLSAEFLGYVRGLTGV